MKRLLDPPRGWIPIAILVGASLGSGLFFLLHPDARAHLLDNRLDPDARRAAAAWAATSLAALVAGYAVLALRRGRASDPGATIVRLRRATDALLPLLLIPLLPVLAVERVETVAPHLTMTLAAAVALVTAVAVYRFPGAPAPRAGAKATTSSWAPAAAVVLLVLAYGTTAALFSVRHHHNLGTATYDLGIYDNVLYQTLHGRPFGSVYSRMGTHLSAHAEPILILLAPFYALAPRAEFLLVLQSFWIAATAVPVYQLARATTGRPWIAVSLAAAVLLHPALHGTNFYDFHTLSLISPFVLWAILGLETGRMRLYWISVALLLLMREDMALLVSFVAAHAILSGRAPRAGAASILVAAGYLAAVKAFLMPSSGLLMAESEESYSFAYYYEDLLPDASEGAAGLLISVLANPVFALRHALAPAKLLLLAQLFVPLLGLPLLARRGKVMMIYGLAFLLLASRTPVFTVHFQYTALIFPVLFALAAIALGDLPSHPLLRGRRTDPRRLATALAAGILCATATASAKFGALVPNDSFRAGFERPRFVMTEEGRARYRWLRESLEMTDPQDSIATTRNLAPHASNRPSTDVFPKLWGAEWLLLDLGAVTGWGRENLERLRERDVYETVRRHDGLELLRLRDGAELPERTPAPRRARPGAPGRRGATPTTLRGE